MGTSDRERQAASAERKRKAGRVKFCVWVHVDDRDALRAYAKSLDKRRKWTGPGEGTQ